MKLSITLVWLLPFAACLATPPTANSLAESTLRALINPPLVDGSGATPTTSHDNLVSPPVTLADGRSFKTVAELKDAITASVKSQLMTSLAAMSPEMASTAAGTSELSQLNLMGGINNLVRLVVEKILQSLLPAIFGQTTPTAPATPTLPAPASNPMGGFPGMFGGMGGMNPFGMMMPSMMLNMMDNFF